jgi:hypothetical protein
MRYLDNALLPSRDAGMLSVEITVEL